MKIYAISIVKLHVCCIAAYLYQKINDEQRHQKVHHCWHSRRDDNNSENDPGKFCIKLLVTHGREFSKQSMSLENLFTILPTGVFSKKLKGALITPANVFWWIFLADVTMMNIEESSQSTFKRAAKKQEHHRGQTKQSTW